MQLNVVPSELCLGFDIRLPPTINLNDFEKKLNDFFKEAGEGITMEFAQKVFNNISHLIALYDVVKSVSIFSTVSAIFY